MNRETGTFEEIFGPHSHLSAEALAAYVGGSLEPTRARRVEGHLAACTICRREADDLKTAMARADESRLEEEPFVAAFVALDTKEDASQAPSQLGKPRFQIVEDGQLANNGVPAVRTWPSGLALQGRFTGWRKAAAADSELGGVTEQAGSSEGLRQVYVFEVAQGAFRVLQGMGTFYLEFADGAAPAAISLSGMSYSLRPSEDWPGLLQAPTLRARELSAFHYVYSRDPGGADAWWR